MFLAVGADRAPKHRLPILATAPVPFENHPRPENQILIEQRGNLAGELDQLALIFHTRQIVSQRRELPLGR